jgi:hypothetical protein
MVWVAEEIHRWMQDVVVTVWAADKRGIGRWGTRRTKGHTYSSPPKCERICVYASNLACSKRRSVSFRCLEVQLMAQGVDQCSVVAANGRIGAKKDMQEADRASESGGLRQEWAEVISKSESWRSY